MSAHQKIHYKHTRIVRKYVKKSEITPKKSNFSKLRVTPSQLIKQLGNQNHCPTCGAFVGNKGKKKGSGS